MQIFAHFRECKKAADRGHAMDVGNVNGLRALEEIRAFGGEVGVRILASGHIEGNEETADTRLKLEFLAVLIFCFKGREDFANGERFLGACGKDGKKAKTECEAFIHRAKIEEPKED